MTERPQISVDKADTDSTARWIVIVKKLSPLFSMIPSSALLKIQHFTGCFLLTAVEE
jgi:hypothetical protein